jgi:hypothetical protein
MNEGCRMEIQFLRSKDILRAFWLGASGTHSELNVDWSCGEDIIAGRQCSLVLAMSICQDLLRLLRPGASKE